MKHLSLYLFWAKWKKHIYNSWGVTCIIPALGSVTYLCGVSPMSRDSASQFGIMIYNKGIHTQKPTRHVLVVDDMQVHPVNSWSAPSVKHRPIWKTKQENDVTSWVSTPSDTPWSLTPEQNKLIFATLRLLQNHHVKTVHINNSPLPALLSALTSSSSVILWVLCIFNPSEQQICHLPCVFSWWTRKFSCFQAKKTMEQLITSS